MTETEFKPDLNSEGRCISVHWSLPAQCVLSSRHRENWHETWHPTTGNRLRYRHPGKLTEELHHGEWHTVRVPIGAARVATIRSLYLGLPVVEELLGEVERADAEARDAREVVAALLLGIELFVGFDAIQSLDLAALPAWATPWLAASRGSVIAEESAS